MAFIILVLCLIIRIALFFGENSEIGLGVAACGIGVFWVMALFACLL